MITLTVLAAALMVHSDADRAADAPVAVQWNSMGATLPDAAKPQDASAAAIVEALLRGGGLLGGGKSGGSTTRVWTAAGEGLNPGSAASGLEKTPDAPPKWFELDATKKESAAAVFTFDANALRANAEKQFDAPWLQRVLNRLALDNARVLSVRAAILPAPADDLPRLLEVKAFASARSLPPGPAKTVTLVAPGWTGTPGEAAALSGCDWGACLRFDAGGLGAVGRDGGVGTFAGVLRQWADVIGTVNTADTAGWAKAYATWADRSSDEVRAVSTRLQQRGTVGCFGAPGAPELVLMLPARRGERVDTLTKAVGLLAATGPMSSSGGVWTLKDAGPLTPRLTMTVCDTGAGPYVVASVERDSGHKLLQQTVSRLQASK